MFGSAIKIISLVLIFIYNVNCRAYNIQHYGGDHVIALQHHTYEEQERPAKLERNQPNDASPLFEESAQADNPVERFTDKNLLIDVHTNPAPAPPAQPKPQKKNRKQDVALRFVLVGSGLTNQDAKENQFLRNFVLIEPAGKSGLKKRQAGNNLNDEESSIEKRKKKRNYDDNIEKRNEYAIEDASPDNE